jgi:Fe-S oxidoreductase
MIAAHAAKKDTLLLLGVDAKYMVCKQARKAALVLESAGVDFTLLADEPASGAQLDFLIGAADETKAQMAACAAVLNNYKTVVVYDPADAKVIKQLYKEYGIEISADVVTYTAYLADLVKSGKLAAKKSGKTVVFQDPFQLSRDLGETEEARAVISAFADLHEMLLNREETVWAGNILMAQYKPEMIKKVAERRIFNAKSIGEKVMVTASVSEYAALTSVEQNDVEILSLEDLILG